MFEKIKVFVLAHKYAVMFGTAVVVGVLVYLKKKK